MRLISRTFTDPIVYGNATGRVKVLETKLFNKSRIERLVQAEDLSEQLNILAETDYGEFSENIQTAEDIEEALNKYLAKVYDFLEEVIKKEPLIRFFRIKYDYHNLKVLLKTKYLGTDAEKIWSYLGLLDVNEARDFIQKDAPKKLPEPYATDVKEAMERFDQNQDGQEIDIALDRGLYREWFEIARSLGNPFLNNFIKIAIDLANLRTFLRAKNLSREDEFIARALFGNGLVEEELLISLYKKSLGDLADELSATPYETIVANVIKEKNEVDLEKLDKEVDNYLLRYVQRVKLIAVGPEPLLGYIFAKENEVNAIRIILTGKLDGLPAKVIDERVRELYV